MTTDQRIIDVITTAAGSSPAAGDMTTLLAAAGLLDQVTIDDTTGEVTGADAAVHTYLEAHPALAGLDVPQRSSSDELASARLARLRRLGALPGDPELDKTLGPTKDPDTDRAARVAGRLRRMGLPGGDDAA